MGWLASLGVAAVTGVTTMLAAGFAASLAVGWYRISSFEGQSGYFVVALAFLGLLGGLLVGVVTARMLAGGEPSALRALGLAQLLALGAVVLVSSTARLLADVPPRLDGEELHLAVEFQWPEGAGPAGLPDSAQWFVRLATASGRTVRANREGPLWREDARLENGRWVVPGAVEIFTSRGQRLLDVAPPGVIGSGFIVPLPGRPGRQFREWSEWLPRVTAPDSAPAGGFRYRFRVVPRNQPIRVETFGEFEVATIASHFGRWQMDGAAPTWTAGARFAIRHRGRPVEVEHPSAEQPSPRRVDRFDAVAAVPGPRPALVLRVDDYWQSGTCLLAWEDEAAALRVEPVAPCSGALQGILLSADPGASTAGREAAAPSGHFDRSGFAAAGLYFFHGAVLDTRDLSLRRFSPEHLHRWILQVPPLGSSPDGLSIVGLGHGDSPDQPVLHVLEVDRDSMYVLPIDASRMRYISFDQIDPGWVQYHFAWIRDAQGRDRLVERPDFTPMPWQGSLALDPDGYREYRLMPAREELRSALIELLVAELGAERLPASGSDYLRQVRIGEMLVSLSWNPGGARVGVWVDRGTDSRLVETIAQRFDAALRTGRYDHLFGR
jgi:hypothetical protein